MKRVQLLDCTLRDGGYLVDAQFGNTVIKGMIKGLSESGIDVVECGFLKDEPHQKGSTIFNNAAQLRPFLPEDRRQTSYVCLADYSRYTISNLEPFDGTSIDGVRACFFKKERYDVIDFCKSIVEKGYKLYVQPVDQSAGALRLFSRRYLRFDVQRGSAPRILSGKSESERSIPYRIPLAQQSADVLLFVTGIYRHDTGTPQNCH